MIISVISINMLNLINNIRHFISSEDDAGTEEAAEEEDSGEQDKEEDEYSSDWDGVDAAAIYAKWSKKKEGTKLERY